MDTSSGYEINPAGNGGVTVTSRGGPGYMGDLVAAFTTPADMITWLAEQYGMVASLATPEPEPNTVSIEISEGLMELVNERVRRATAGIVADAVRNHNSRRT